jgi:pentatricopeptide repeat protein
MARWLPSDAWGSRRYVSEWTTLISSYVQTGRPKEAIQAFVAMLRGEAPSDSASPNEYTFAAGIAACAADISCVHLGEQLHSQAARGGFASARSVANSLVTRGSPAVSRQRMPCSGKALPRMLSLGARSYGAMHAQEGLAEEAFALFTEMRRHHCPCPNEFTLASLLSVCATSATLDARRQLHALAVASGLEHHAMIRSALVDMYGKSVFSNRTEDDVVSWTAMIVGHAKHGHSKRALELFECALLG